MKLHALLTLLVFMRLISWECAGGTWEDCVAVASNVRTRMEARGLTPLQVITQEGQY